MNEQTMIGLMMNEHRTGDPEKTLNQCAHRLCRNLSNEHRNTLLDLRAYAENAQHARARNQEVLIEAGRKSGKTQATMNAMSNEIAALQKRIAELEVNADMWDWCVEWWFPRRITIGGVVTERWVMENCNPSNDTHFPTPAEAVRDAMERGGA